MPKPSRLSPPAAPQTFVPRGNAPKNSKQGRNERVAAKLTEGGTITPTGNKLKKYNRAVGNVGDAVNKRAGQLGYGKNAYSQSTGLQGRQFTSPIKAGLQKLASFRRPGGSS